MHPATRQSDIQRLQNRVLELAREKRELETQLKSARARNAQLLRAANGSTPTAHIAVVYAAANLAPTLRIAALLEEEGRVSVIRWARDAGRAIIGIELSTLVVEQRGGEMAVEAGEPMEARVS